MANVNSFQYSRWIYIIARTLRFNYGTGSEKNAVKDFITSVLPNRPWLQTAMNNKSNSGLGYVDINDETDNSIAEMLEVIARDLKKTPMNDNEKLEADNLISATGDRRYGDLGNLI